LHPQEHHQRIPILLPHIKVLLLGSGLTLRLQSKCRCVITTFVLYLFAAIRPILDGIL
jgi:hypothetical protein